LPGDFYFFKLTQPLKVSTVQLLYTVKEKGGKPDKNPHPLLYGLRNPYRNFKSENSETSTKLDVREFGFSTLLVLWVGDCSGLGFSGLFCSILDLFRTFLYLSAGL
jgi:hypothetical protein